MSTLDLPRPAVVAFSVRGLPFATVALVAALVGDSSLRPLARMRDLPTNQDACRRAVLVLEYCGLATR
jgi:hypothetical protein